MDEKDFVSRHYRLPAVAVRTIASDYRSGFPDVFGKTRRRASNVTYIDTSPPSSPGPRRYGTARRRRRRDCCAREARKPSSKIESRRRHRRRELGDTASVRSRRSPRYRRLRPVSTSLRELHVRECFAIIFLRVSREFFANVSRRSRLRVVYRPCRETFFPFGYFSRSSFGRTFSLR